MSLEVRPAPLLEDAHDETAVSHVEVKLVVVVQSGDDDHDATHANAGSRKVRNFTHRLLGKYSTVVDVAERCLPTPPNDKPSRQT